MFSQISQKGAKKLSGKVTSEKEWWILYVNRYNIIANDYKVYKYKVFTNDIYHVIGYMYCTTIEDIKRVSYCKCKADEDISSIKEYYYK